MKVLYINNQGGGYAGYKECPNGTTVEMFFSNIVRDVDHKQVLVRVNRQIVPPEEILKEGDRVTATPTKVDGA